MQCAVVGTYVHKVDFTELLLSSADRPYAVCTSEIKCDYFIPSTYVLRYSHVFLATVNDVSAFKHYARITGLLVFIFISDNNIAKPRTVLPSSDHLKYHHPEVTSSLERNANIL